MKNIEFIIGSILLLFAGISGIAASQDKPFYFGVYVYDYRFSAIAKEKKCSLAEAMDEHWKILKDKGVNSLHLTVSDPSYLPSYVALADKYDMNLFLQLDFAYFRSQRLLQENQKMVAKCKDIIARYVSHPRIIAWSFAEEIPPKDLKKLSDYYKLWQKAIPGLKLGIVHNNIESAKNLPAPNPVIYGVDRYAFWFEVSMGGYLASPAFSLQWVRAHLEEFFRTAKERNADFIVTINGGGMLMPRYANHIMKDAPDSLTPDELTTRKRARKWVKEGRMGWKMFKRDDGQDADYLFWKYYRLPENCMRALAWATVAEGGRLFFVWMYMPQSKAIDSMSLKNIARSQENEVYRWTLAGNNQTESPELNEYSQAIKEIKRFENIITKMEKQDKNPVFKSNIFQTKAFKIPGMTGTIIVAWNPVVGSWPSGSKYMIASDDQVFINDDGKLAGYIPNKQKQLGEITIPKTNMLYDLSSNKAIKGYNNVFKIEIYPGSGNLYFIGSAKEAEKLHSMLKIP